MTALASRLLGGRKALVYSDQVFIKPPEVGGPKPYHQDNWYFGVTSSDDVLTAWVALDDASEENVKLGKQAAAGRGSQIFSDSQTACDYRARCATSTAPTAAASSRTP